MEDAAKEVKVRKIRATEMVLNEIEKVYGNLDKVDEIQEVYGGMEHFVRDYMKAVLSEDKENISLESIREIVDGLVEDKEKEMITVTVSDGRMGTINFLYKGENIRTLIPYEPEGDYLERIKADFREIVGKKRHKIIYKLKHFPSKKKDIEKSIG